MEIPPHGGHDLLAVHEVGEVALRIMEHKKVFSVMKSLITTIIVSLLGVLCAAYGGNKAGDCVEYTAKKSMVNDVQLDDFGWIARVNRNRVFDVLEIHNPVSTLRWHFTDEDVGQEKHNLYPLEGARIHCLEIYGNEVNAILRNKDGKGNGDLKFETISLKGVQELQTIRFFDTIPEFKENTKWYGAKDSDWRKELKTIYIDQDIKGIERIPFLGDVKRLQLGTNTHAGVMAWEDERKWDKLRQCVSLEKLEIPYSMATNSTIHWGSIIRESGLKDKEVLAFEHDGDGNVVLMNMAANGEISDCVTMIRWDAFPEKMSKRIQLPFKAKHVIGEIDVRNYQFALKKDSLLFYPDILEGKQRSALERSRGFKRNCDVSATSAYENLQITVVAEQGCLSVVRFDSSNRVELVSLYRGKELTNKVTAQIVLVDAFNDNWQEVSVGMWPSKGSKPVNNVEVTFLHAPWTIGGYIKDNAKTSLVFICLLSVVLILMLLTFAWAAARISAKIRHCRFIDNKEWTWFETWGVNYSRRVGFCIGIALGLLILVFGWGEIELLQDYVDRYLTSQTMSYLNSSFISSLVISVSTSLAQLAIGFLQSFSFSLFGLSVDLNSLLEPVQNVMDKVSSYSWIATGVLAFVRIFCQVLKDGAHLIWPTLGGAMVVYSLMCLAGIVKGRRWVALVMSVAFFLSLGLPFLLYCCMLFSNQLQAISGDSFNRAMLDFAALAESFSVRSLTSVAGAQEMLSQFTNAISALTSSAMYYVATKAFDCFLVPLVLYFGFKKALRGFADKKDELLLQIKESLESPNRTMALSSNNRTTAGGESRDASLSDEPNVSVAVSELPSNHYEGTSNAIWWRIKPEWITAGCAIAILIALLVVLLGGNSGQPSAVVATAGSGGSSSGTMPVVAGKLFGISTLGWLIILLFVIVDSWVCWKAACVVRRVRNSDKDPDQKLALLKEDDFYFDLPLYLGLFGTVLGFLFLSGQSESQSGRVIAYFSTVFGILVSVLIHAGVSQYKSICLGVKTEKEVLALRIMKVGVKFVRFMDRLAARFGKFKIKGKGK